MSKNLAVKLKKNNVTLEVLTKPGTMKPYRDGKLKQDNVLVAEEIFSNASKFEKAKTSEIKKCCGTDNKMAAIKLILDEGIFSLNKKEMQEMQDKKRAEIINYLHKYYHDPRPETTIPHPTERLDGVLNDLKIKIEPFESTEGQIKAILKKMQGILPMKPMNPPHEEKYDTIGGGNGRRRN